MPKTPKNVKSFLGLASYYRRFIHQFAKIAEPLNNLLRKDVPFIWDDKTQTAFETLRNKLCEAPILIFPDFKSPFYLITDASGYAVSGVLTQKVNGMELVVSYVSRALNDVEKRWDTFNKQGPALIYCIKH